MSDTKITCQICGEQVHIMKKHLREAHPDVSIDQYKEEYPDAPVLSPRAKEQRARLQAEKKQQQTANHTVNLEDGTVLGKETMRAAFGLGNIKAVKNIAGQDIQVTVVDSNAKYQEYVPAKDSGYIFNVDLLKDICQSSELNMPGYFWGHMGSGKSTGIEQYCAHTNRPMMRVQHTINTEESNILGQMQVADGKTFFSPGPLAIAMKYGLVYLADEYDGAMPHVCLVYQPVLEGKALIIKEAPEDSEWHVVQPHPNFRFFATGNTNGSGDSTGLYQGTNIGNAANYERFAIVRKVEYMPRKQLLNVVSSQSRTGSEECETLIDFAQKINEAYEGSEISLPISPRALINAAKIGSTRLDMRAGVRLAYINRLDPAAAEVADQIAQRVWG